MNKAMESALKALNDLASIGEVIYKQCPHCGAIMEKDTDVVLTSNPPQYRYHCKCGFAEFDVYPPARTYKVENSLAVKGVSIPDEWDNFRREAAKDAMCAMIKEFTEKDLYPDPDEICCMAICYADELIKQLKEETK